MDNTTKILIADENQTSRQTIADGLRRAGFGAIYEASNGEEALELISRLHPAVALVDVWLSKLDGIGVLRGLEMVEVEGATGEIDTNFEGKLEATWASLQKYDFVCLHLEAPDECTHNGDLKGKVQAIEWLDSRLVKPLTERLDAAHMDYRLLLLSDHKTLTATRGHDGDPVPYLLYDSRIDSGRGGVYTEKAGENGPFVAHGCELLHLLFER